MTTLSGLPDIGDPFDVAAFAEKPVPEVENAYVLYRQAAARLGEEPSDMTYDWAQGGPVDKRWLERNREALELWRKGTERPQALYVPSLSMNLMTQLTVVQSIRACVRLAQLEGTRLETEGDLEGAWRWYRAIFRSSRHVGRHATVIERLVGMSLHSVACTKLTRWATDPRVTAPMLRLALDSAIQDYAATGPLSDSLKVEYLAFVKTYDDPNLIRKCLVDPDWNGAGKVAWFARDAKLFSFAKGFAREPERSRRVTRLIYANLLAVCDLPPDRRPPVATTLKGIGAGGVPPLVDLYAIDESSPPAARALPPDKVRQWFDTTLYARNLMPAFNHIFTAEIREKKAQAGLIIGLANRLHEIERGHPAEKVENLIGPYLKALPEGYQPLH